jgi:hypothetical protein
MPCEEKPSEMSRPKPLPAPVTTAISLGQSYLYFSDFQRKLFCASSEKKLFSVVNRPRAKSHLSTVTVRLRARSETYVFRACSIGCWIPSGAMVKMYSSGPVMTGLKRVYLIKAAMMLYCV